MVFESDDIYSDGHRTLSNREIYTAVVATEWLWSHQVPSGSEWQLPTIIFNIVHRWGAPGPRSPGVLRIAYNKIFTEITTMPVGDTLQHNIMCYNV